MVPLLPLALLAAGPLFGAKPPHIVLSVIDDLGWHNLGWRNAEARTPTLDILRKEGVTLDRMYHRPDLSQ